MAVELNPETDNLLRAVHFERPDYTPVRFDFNNACWNHYPREALLELMAEHPLLFPSFNPEAIPSSPNYAPFRVAGKPYTDSWGCVWETIEDGILVLREGKEFLVHAVRARPQ